MTGLSRRAVARGAVWAVPSVAVSAAAPAFAASPCTGIRPGQPLPASAFRANYLVVTNQTFGGLADKSISVAAGVSVDPAVQSCLSGTGLTLSKADTDSYLALTNGNTYTVNGGTEASGSGTAGATTSGCSRGAVTSQVCITITGFGVNSSTGTSSANPSRFSFAQMITVSGHGSTLIYINASSFAQSGTYWNGSGLSITSAASI